LEVNPSFPAMTVPEFITYANAYPGKINMASAGTGSSPHVTGELFKMMTGVKMLHVPYRGEALALTDLIGGQVQVYFGGLPATIEYFRSGKTKPRGSSMRRREFIAGLGSSTVWPVMARAQQGERVRRIGVLVAGIEKDVEVQRRVASFRKLLETGSGVAPDYWRPTD
jgi:hypothetical protein